MEGGRVRTANDRLVARIDGSFEEDIFWAARDGRLLVAVARDHRPREIRVVVNWADEIARKVK